MTEHILSWITFIPLIGMGLILLVPRANTDLVKGISLVATGIPLFLATWLYFGIFERSSGDLQLIERVAWIDAIRAEYFVGVDGLSLALVWLTTLLLFIGVPASFGIEKAQKSYYALLLLLEVGILGVFVSLDYFLFYAEGWSFAVFNLADAFITVGAGLVILQELVDWRRGSRRQPDDQPPADG